MDKDHGLPLAHIKESYAIFIDLYGLKRNSLDQFNPRRKLCGRGASHYREAAEENKKNGCGPQIRMTLHYSK
jgi:hypothetical protein